MTFDRLRYIVTGQWQMADRARRRPGAADTAHRLMSSEDLQWCAERSVRPRARVAWWSEGGRQPIVHAAHTCEYMQLIDQCVIASSAYESEVEEWRRHNHRWQQKRRLRHLQMTWQDTILPLLELDKWTMSQCLIVSHFVRFRLHGVPPCIDSQRYATQPLPPVTQRSAAITALCQRLPFTPDDGHSYYRKTITTLWHNALAYRGWKHCPEAQAELVSCALRHSRVQIQQFVAATPEYAGDGLTWLQIVHKWALEVCHFQPVGAIVVVSHMLLLNQLDDSSAAPVEWVELGAILRAACASYAHHQATRTGFSYVHGHSNGNNTSDETTWSVFIDTMHKAAQTEPALCTNTRLTQVLMCFGRVKLVQSTTTEGHDLMEVTYAEALRAVQQYAASEGTNVTSTTAAARVLSGPKSVLERVQRWQALLRAISQQTLAELPLQIVADIYAMACSDMQDAPLQPSDVAAALQLAIRDRQASSM